MVYVKEHKPLVLFCTDRQLNYSVRCLRPVRLLEIQGIVLSELTVRLVSYSSYWVYSLDSVSYIILCW